MYVSPSNLIHSYTLVVKICWNNAVLFLNVAISIKARFLNFEWPSYRSHARKRNEQKSLWRSFLFLGVMQIIFLNVGCFMNSLWIFPPWSIRVALFTPLTFNHFSGMLAWFLLYLLWMFIQGIVSLSGPVIFYDTWRDLWHSFRR